MLAGDFARNLKKLNRNLRVYAGDNPLRPAGVYYYAGAGEYREICGVAKNYVPEFSVFSPQGLISVGGWRRVLEILLHYKLIDRHEAQRVFRFSFEARKPPRPQIEEDMYRRMWREARRLGELESIRKFGRIEPGYMRLDDVLQIHRARKR